MVSRTTIALLCLVATGPSMAEDLGECWSATFHEQRSGEVREKTRSGGPYGYLYSYEGDFRWVGEPRTAATSDEYVFCFRKRLDDGGVLIVGDKQIPLGRVGSVKLQPLLHETAGYSYTSTRDHYDFPTLYGSFHTPGKADSSLEIQLDRVRRTVTVVARSTSGSTPVASFMQADAVPVDR